MSRYDCETHPDARWDEHYECDDCREDINKAIKTVSGECKASNLACQSSIAGAGIGALGPNELLLIMKAIEISMGRALKLLEALKTLT